MKYIGSILLLKNIVSIKVVFKPYEFRMAGQQFIIQYKDDNSYEVFRKLIIEKINLLLERYKYSVNSINHVIITFIPVNNNITNRFKSVKREKLDISKFINDNFARKTIIPVSVNTKFLGNELAKEIEKGKIVEVKFIDIFTDKTNTVSLADSFDIEAKQSCLSTSFKFYYVILNGSPYIFLIDYLSLNSIRKLRLNTSGNIIEDVFDTVLEDDTIKSFW